MMVNKFSKLKRYKVTAVENGRLARDELLKEDAYFDLVLLNLMMPEMVRITNFKFMLRLD